MASFDISFIDEYPVQEEEGKKDFSVTSPTSTKGGHSYNLSDYDDEELDLDKISFANKAIFGARKENTFAGSAWDIGKATIRAFRDDTEVSEELEYIREENLSDLIKEMPQFRGYKESMFDAGIMTGETATALADPVTFLIPWAKIAKLSKVGAGAVGGVIGATDAAAYDYARTGEVSALGVGAGTVLGGTSTLINKLLVDRALGKNATETIKAFKDPEITKRVPLEPPMSPEVTGGQSLSSYVQNLENVTRKAVSPEKTAELVEEFKDLPKTYAQVLSLRKQIERATRLEKTAKTKKTKNKHKQTIEMLTPEYEKVRAKYALDHVKSSLSKIDQAELALNTAEAEGKISKGLVGGLMYNLTKPVAGGTIGWATGHLTGMEDDDILMTAFIASGIAAGQASKMLQRTKLSKLDLETGQMAVEEAMKNSSAMQKRILTSGGVSTQGNSLGGWSKAITNMLLPRLGSATQSVEEKYIYSHREFLGKTIKQFDDSWDDLNTRKLIGEATRGYVDLEKLSPGYKGLTGDYKPITQVQIDEAKRLLPYVKKSQEELKNSVRGAGINFKELDDYGMAQVYDFKEISKDTKRWRTSLEKALRIQMGPDVSDVDIVNRVDRITDQLTGVTRQGGKADSRIQTNVFETVNGKTQFRPLTQHFEKHRMITDPDAAKVLAKDGFLMMDIGQVLDVYSSRTLKVTEFAKTFGPNGEVIDHALKDVAESFGKHGAELLPQQRRYEQQIKDTLGLYWGTYGKQWDAPSAVNSTVSLLTTAANMKFLVTLPLTSLTELTQPVANQGFKAAIKAARGAMKEGESFAGKGTFQYDKSWERDFSVLHGHGIDPLNRVQGLSQDVGNWYFTKILQMRRITEASRNFAYDTGVHRAFDLSRKKNLKNSDIVELASLGIEQPQLDVLRKYKTAKEAFDTSTDGYGVLNLAGSKAADTDILIPMMGNRAFFTQHPNPLIRMFGQFLSFAQAKMSQTNHLLERVEQGDGKLAVRMLGLIPVFSAANHFIDTVKGSYDSREFDAEPLSEEGLAEGTEFQGLIPWQISKAGNAYKYDSPESVAPAGTMGWKTIQAFTDSLQNVRYGDMEGALENWMNVVPFGPEYQRYAPYDYQLRDFAERRPAEETREGLYEGSLIEGASGDPEVQGVPKTSAEPEKRIDRVTGRPYDEQAGTAHVDIEDRTGNKLLSALRRARNVV